jgi:hypothetical protein
MISPFDRYLAHLDRISAGVEPRFFPIDSTNRTLKQVIVLTYNDLPEAGYLTGITYGLSLADHPDWQTGRPELTITVRSNDIGWAVAVGSLAAELRGQCPFSYGNTLNFRQRISPDSEMTAFVVFAPAVLERSDYSNIDVGRDLVINIAGCYPIHDVERRFVHENGLMAFWELDWDLYDVKRTPVV